MESRNSLPPGTRIGHVHLRVHSLDRALKFYHELLGFKPVFQTETEVALSSTGRLPFHFLLTEDNAASPRTSRMPGLFHVAIRFPERKQLAKTILRLIRSGYPLQGASDHGVSEALYLSDPEGNGVELYVDRPEEAWKWSDGEIVMVTEALDLQNLLSSAEGEEWRGIHSGTDIGHVHLSVSSLARAGDFYIGGLGFDLTTGSYPGALFMSAGGYHHHIGANIWMTRNAEPAQPNTAGLVSFGVVLPGNIWEKYPAELSARKIPFQEVSGPSGQSMFKLHDLDGIGVDLVADIA